MRGQGGDAMNVLRNLWAALQKNEPQPLKQPGFDAGRLRVRGWGLTRRVTVNDSVEGLFRHVGVFLLYVRYGTRLCAHALNPTMHRPSVAKTATLNSASIMAPSTESRLPLEGLICHRGELFPVASNTSDDHPWASLTYGGLEREA